MQTESPMEGFVQSSLLHKERSLDELLPELSSGSDTEEDESLMEEQEVPVVSPLDKKANAQIKREIQEKFQV